MFLQIITATYYPILWFLAILSGPSNALGAAILWITINAIKKIVKETRPDGSDHESFPSGHAAGAWYFVYIYTQCILILIWAILASFSRILLKRHYPHDVFVGILIAILFAYLWKQYGPHWPTWTKLFKQLPISHMPYGKYDQSSLHSEPMAS